MVVPPDLDRLRAYVKGEPGSEASGYLAARFLLSLAESGGRLVAEQPCEHGDDWLTCDAEDCPGGFRTRVWPTDKEEE